MIEALYLFYRNGLLLIQRNYREVTQKSDICQFVNKYIKTKKIYENPIVELNNEFFVNVVLDEIAITVMTKSNSNICLIFNFIYKFIDILNYFFNNNISGLNVVNNFALIYEICDEVIDYGYPQNMEINVLKNHLINKAKYYNKTSKYYQKLANGMPCLNSVIEGIIEDSKLRNSKEDGANAQCIGNYNINHGISSTNNNVAYSNNMHIYNTSCNHINYDANNSHTNVTCSYSAIDYNNIYLGKDTYPEQSGNCQNNKFCEKGKLKYIGREALNKIKNKIVPNSNSLNTRSFMNGNCTWRNNNIYYKKNEIYMDILEVLNVTINSNNLIHAHINGRVIIKCLLSGMPLCELSTDNKLQLLKNAKKNANKKKINLFMMMKSKNYNSTNMKNAYDGHNKNSNKNKHSSNNSSICNDNNNNQIKREDTVGMHKTQGSKHDMGNDETSLANCIFHNCVTLTTHDNEQKITFIPPDGSFELMRYTVTKNIQIPFQIIALYSPVIRCNKTGERKFFLKSLTNTKNTKTEFKYPHVYEYTVTVRANFEKNQYALDVILKIPIYKYSENVEVHYKSAGKAEFNNAETFVIWKIKKFVGDTEHTIKIRLTLENQDILCSTVKNTQKVYNVPKVVLHADQVKNMNTVKFLNTYKLPITMCFQIPMFTCSGMCIRSLKIFEKSSYKVSKWIKYITEAGIYQYK